MKNLLYTLTALCIFILVPRQSTAQKQEKEGQQEMKQFDDAEERQGVKLNIVPGPMYDPSIKFGLFIAPILTYYPTKGDLISPASQTSFYAMYTTNKSYIAGFNNELYLSEDRWRLRFRGGGGALNKDLSLYGVDADGVLDTTSLTIADAKQKVFQLDIYAMRKVVDNLYLGLGANYKKITIEGNDGKADTLVAANGLGSGSGNFGLQYKVDYDTRDNVNYPYSGYYVSYTGYQYFKSDGKENNYFNNTLQVMGFWSLKPNNRHIIAGKFYSNILTGNPESTNYSYYGRINGDVQRGYQSGRRVDKNAVNIETEYRYTTPWFDDKIRLVGLLGTGKVFGEYNNFTDAEWLPVVGTGVRYAILPYERINIRFDVTYSKDDFIWYFGIREAF